MCGGLILAFIGGALIGRRLGRWGGSCGRGGWRGGIGPFAQFGRRAARHATTRYLEHVMGALELNARQNEEAAALFGRLRDALATAPHKLRAVLVALGEEPFSRDAAATALGTLPGLTSQAELLDALEHVHNILTTEQQERLRAVVKTAGM